MDLYFRYRHFPLQFSHLYNYQTVFRLLFRRYQRLVFSGGCLLMLHFPEIVTDVENRLILFK